MIKFYRFPFVLFLVFTVQMVFAQEQIISGIVSDNSGLGMPGVNIIIKGSNKGTTTDINGGYKITAENGNVLVFSFIGFATKEVVVSGKRIDITLIESSNSLKEFVVTAFGIKKESRVLGYSVTQIKSKDLDLSSLIDPMQALQGRVAGLQINKTSGSAGGGFDILIRGVTSVDPSRNNQPLIIVDGLALDNETFTGNVMPSAGSNAYNSSEQFSFSNRASDLNPDDIETYSVLKGAAATALYGVRAANGAIVITTKRGKKGKPKVNLSLSTTFRNVVKTPELQETYREGHRTTKIPGAVINNDSPDGYDNYGQAFYSWGVPYSDDSFTLDDGSVIDLSNDAFHSPYDLFKTGVNNQMNFNISGANDKIDYFFSASDIKDNGILPNTNYYKTSFRFHTGYQATKNFKISTSVNYIKNGGAQANGGDKSVFSALSYWSSTFPVNDYLLADGTQKNYSSGILDNPRYFLETSNLENTVNRWVGNINLMWNPFEFMDITYSAQVDNYSDLRERFVPSDLDVGTQVNGFIVKEDINFMGLESNFMANFHYDFNKNFKANLILGNQISDRKRNYSYIRGESLNVAGINDLTNTLNIFAGNSIIQYRNIGAFGELKLDFKRKLYLSLTGRNDWVSTLPDENRSFFYPSISTSYVFTEDIFKESNIFTFGKIRLSLAQVGKSPAFGKVGHYYIPDANFPFNGAAGFRISTALGDLNIKPERDNSFEAGMDFRFFKNRLRIDYTYYSTYVKNQIFTVGSAYSSGLSGVTQNAGDYKTWGNEIMVDVDIIKNTKILWTTTLNWSRNTGKITALPDYLNEIVFLGDRITAKAKVGDALGSLYGWVFQTVASGERYVNADGKWVVTGSENNGYYYTGNNEMVKVGNAFPDFVASINNNINWKKFSLNFLIEWKNGGDLYDRGYRNALRNGNLKETEFRDQYLVLAGMMDDGAGAYVENDIPLLITADSFYRDYDNYNNASEVLLKDGSWIKLRNISLSYTFNGPQIKKMHIQKFSIYASAGNIILWTPFKGYDPEGNQYSAGSNIYGYTGLIVPLSQTYSLGLKFAF